MNDLQHEFETRGLVAVDAVFDSNEVETYTRELKKAGPSKKDAWLVSDGVIQTSAFWPLLTHRRLLATLRNLFGTKDIKVCQHNDLQLGKSSFSWHRDSVNRVYDPTLPNWREDDAKFQLARCAIYLQPEESGFRFGYVPGSHRQNGYLEPSVFESNERHLSLLNSLYARASGHDALKERAEWVRTRPGQVVFFDPRLIHTGGTFAGTKYSIFVAFGVENRHFYEHYSYYRYLRQDLSYQRYPEELMRLLKDQALYVEEQQYADKIDGAFVPGRLLGQAFKLFNNKSSTER